MRTVLLIVAVAFAAAPSAGADKHPKKPVDPNKRMCRQETPTGSMMSKSTCHTRAEWQAIDAADAQQTRNFSNGLQQAAGTGQR